MTLADITIKSLYEIIKSSTFRDNFKIFFVIYLSQATYLLKNIMICSISSRNFSINEFSDKLMLSFVHIFYNGNPKESVLNRIRESKKRGDNYKEY